MPPAVPRRPQAAESKPPRPGPHLLPRGAGLRARPPCGPGAMEERGRSGGPGPGQRGPRAERPQPGRRAAGGPRPALTRAGDGPERAQGWPPPPGRPEATKNHPAATGGRLQPARRAARRAPQARPLVADHLGGGLPPPSDGRGRNRPTQTTAARDGPGRTPLAPATTRPPAAEARRGVAGGKPDDCNGRAFLFRLAPSMGPNNAEGAIAPNRDGGAAGLAPGGLAARAAGGTE